MNWRIIRLKLKPKIPALIRILIMISFFSCNLKVVSEDYRPLKNSKWHQDSILTFDFNIPDSTKLYNLSLTVRNEGKYLYSNLYLFVSINPPSGKVFQDTVELTLADKYGKWAGSGLGDLYEKKYPYKQNVFFPEKGTYKLKVRQGMRTEDEVLKGIHDFGFCLERTH